MTAWERTKEFKKLRQCACPNHCRGSLRTNVKAYQRFDAFRLSGTGITLSSRYTVGKCETGQFGKTGADKYKKGIEKKLPTVAYIAGIGLGPDEIRKVLGVYRAPGVETVFVIRGDKEAVLKLGIETALDQCKGLLDKGGDGLHFYTMDRYMIILEILCRLSQKNYLALG